MDNRQKLIENIWFKDILSEYNMDKRQNYFVMGYLLNSELRYYSHKPQRHNNMSSWWDERKETPTYFLA